MTQNPQKPDKFSSHTIHLQKLRRNGVPLEIRKAHYIPMETRIQKIKAKAALRATRIGLKPKASRTRQEQLAFQKACMQRLRLEKRGQPTAFLPPRIHRMRQQPPA